MRYISHADETVVEPSLMDALTHQPLWVSLLILAFVMFGVYALLEKLKVKPANRIITLLPLVILIAIVYMRHNAAVSTVLMSVGFAAAFFFAFTSMTATKKDQPKQKDEQGKTDEVPE